MQVVHFGEFTLDVARCVVRRAGQDLLLRPKAFNVLAYLVKHRGRVITKEELFENVWSGAARTDGALVQSIRDIRDALADSERQIIKTIPSRGYLFAAEVTADALPQVPLPTSSSETLLGSWPASPWNNAVRSILALPRHGVLLLAATALLMVGVIASVFWPQQTAPSRRDQAYVLFRQADMLFTNRRSAKDNADARHLFEHALHLDGDHVPSLIGYAATQLEDVLNGWSPQPQHADQLASAGRALERAIALEPTHVYAHRFKGRLLRAQGKPQEAIVALEHALALNPYIAPAHAELGRVKIEAGRAAEAVSHVETAIRLSPSDRWIYVWCFWAALGALHAGDDVIAAEWFDRARKTNPTVMLPALPLWTAAAYALTGREDEAGQLAAAHLRANPDYTMSSWTQSFPARSPILAKQRERIAAILRRLGVPEDKPQTGSVRLQ